MSWLNCGFVHKEGSTDNLRDLKEASKRQIVESIFELTCVSQETKDTILNKVLGDDVSDVAKNCRLTCKASIPTAENKAEIWEALTSENSEYSMYEREAMISGFYSYDQLDILDQYFDKFFEVLPSIYKNQAARYFDRFCFSLLPKMNV
jgi:3-methyladenine DNA glycosylase AlkD